MYNCSLNNYSRKKKNMKQLQKLSVLFIILPLTFLLIRCDVPLLEKEVLENPKVERLSDNSFSYSYNYGSGFVVFDQNRENITITSNGEKNITIKIDVLSSLINAYDSKTMHKITRNSSETDTDLDLQIAELATVLNLINNTTGILQSVDRTSSLGKESTYGSSKNAREVKRVMQCTSFGSTLTSANLALNNDKCGYTWPKCSDPIGRDCSCFWENHLCICTETFECR